MDMFIDKPRIYHWMNKEEIAFLFKMHEGLKLLVQSDKLLSKSNFKVKYVKDLGESSFVAILISNDSKLVFKSSKKQHAIKIEHKALMLYKDAGIKVPQIIKIGSLNNCDFFIQEYIDEVILSYAYKPDELIYNKKIYEMGKILSNMSTIKCQGYGKINLYKFSGKNTTFTEYISESLISNLDNIKSKHITDNIYAKLEYACKVIEDSISKHQIKSSLCHMDFSVYNIFNTNPLTVFDASSCRVNIPYIDLAQTILIMFNLSNDITEYKNELVKGYTQNGLIIDEKTLNACLYVQGVKKMTTWIKKKRYAKVKVLEDYIYRLDF